MKRPPFLRRRPAGGRWNRWQRGLRNLFLLAVAVSLYQFTIRGEVTWPAALVDAVREQAGHPDAGWQHAREALEEQGERREGSPPPAADLRGRVVRVADGDTLSLLDDRGEQYKIRLYGIDTPELAQAHGRAARRALSDMVYQREVAVVVHEEDDYQRQVGTVYRGGDNINLALVAGGHAWWYRHHAPHERPLEAAEREARRQRLGLWGGSDPIPPWDWRREQRAR